ncbi:YkvA family protein [Mixta sp. Marseille-Q2659]|uniref:YkvA family protein n=1 Tax=Mixta sp. Marseille-Q2659 TaxID=2736607 RepID=UPI0023BA2E5A|nr:YkvA family protein [Mixta sp. Marseille-Q2659]
MLFNRLRRWARLIKKDALTLWFACRDPQAPLWLKVFTGVLAAYTFSPIDLIPDVIPLVGWLDDAVIVPSGVMLLLRAMPAQVRARSLAKVERRQQQGKKLISRSALVILLLLWLALLMWGVRHFMS